MYVSIADRLSARTEALLWALMAAVVAVHSQIEMTAVMPTTVMWSLAVIFVAGARRDDLGDGKRWSGIVLSGIAIAMMSLAIGVAVPHWKQERLLQGASRIINASTFENQFELSAKRTREQILASLGHEARETERALEMMQQANRFWSNPEITNATAKQRMRLAYLWRLQSEEDAARAATLTMILELESLQDRSPVYAGQFGSVLEGIRQEVGGVDDGEEALGAWRRASEFDPWGLEPAKAIYRILREIGETEAAGAAAVRFLEIDAAKYLDPLRQLSDEERAEVQAFLESLFAPENLPNEAR